MHAECLDTVLSEDLLLPTIDVPQTDIHQLVRADDVLILQPAKDIGAVLPGQPGQERHGHTVDVTAGAHLGEVNIGMGIDPDDGHLAAQSLADRLGCTGDGTDGDGVVAAQGEHELAVLGVVVDLRAEALSHGADGARLLHVAVVWVLSGDILLVVVDDVVVVDVVVKVLAQLGEQAGLDQSHRRGLDALLHLENRGFSMRVCTSVSAVASYLSAIETDGHHTQLVGVGEETRSDSGWQRHRAFGRMQYAVCRLFAEHEDISATRSTS